MRGDAAHVVSSGPQFAQGLNLDQSAILQYAANAKLIVIRKTLSHRGYI
jgi:hypothetical protein